MKKIVALLALLCLLVPTAIGMAQSNQFKTRIIGSTSDAFIDSLQVAKHQRLYINHIYAWYDNAANTNPFSFEIVEGMSQMAVQGFAGRLYKHLEAMTSAGIKRIVIEDVNIMTSADSTVYVAVAATGSDSLLVSYTYAIIPE